MVYTRDEIAALADVLVKHPDTWIICDDIYNRLIFDGIGYHNVLQVQPSSCVERTDSWSILAVEDLRACRVGASA